MRIYYSLNLFISILSPEFELSKLQYSVSSTLLITMLLLLLIFFTIRIHINYTSMIFHARFHSWCQMTWHLLIVKLKILDWLSPRLWTTSSILFVFRKSSIDNFFDIYIHIFHPTQIFKVLVIYRAITYYVIFVNISISNCYTSHQIQRRMLCNMTNWIIHINFYVSFFFFFFFWQKV